MLIIDVLIFIVDKKVLFKHTFKNGDDALIAYQTSIYNYEYNMKESTAF